MNFQTKKIKTRGRKIVIECISRTIIQIKLFGSGIKP